jgi:hypothetical protein
MKFHFFRYNYFRQFIFYGLIGIFALAATDYKHQSAAVLIISGCIAGVLFAALIYQYLSYIVIDENGIMYKSLFKQYYLRWDEIGQIRVIKRWNGNSVIPWIIILRSDDPADLYRKRNAFNREYQCITFAFFKKAMPVIAKYYKQADFTSQCVAVSNEKTIPVKTANNSGIKTTVLNKLSILYMAVPFSFCFAFGIVAAVIKIKYFMYDDALGIGACLCLVPILLLLFFYYSAYGRYKFIINEKGVEFRDRKKKAYKMKWGDVESIRVLPNAKGARGRWAIICFSSRPNQYFTRADIKAFNETFFGVQYRNRVVREIKKYWKESIHGLY